MLRIAAVHAGGTLASMYAIGGVRMHCTVRSAQCTAQLHMCWADPRAAAQRLQRGVTNRAALLGEPRRA